MLPRKWSSAPWRPQSLGLCYPPRRRAPSSVSPVLLPVGVAGTVEIPSLPKPSPEPVLPLHALPFSLQLPCSFPRREKAPARWAFWGVRGVLLVRASGAGTSFVLACSLSRQRGSLVPPGERSQARRRGCRPAAGALPVPAAGKFSAGVGGHSWGRLAEQGLSFQRSFWEGSCVRRWKRPGIGAG